MSTWHGVEANPRKVEVYKRPNGDEPFLDWMRGEDNAGRSAIIARINKLRRGILSDYDDVGDGILELRFIGPGPGYRIYCADDGRSIVLLLCGGIKRTQAADINYAKVLWSEYNDGKKAKPKNVEHRSFRRSVKQ